jgi:hypothetical protein
MTVRRLGITSRRWRGAWRLAQLLTPVLVVLLACGMPAQALARDSQHSAHISPAQVLFRAESKTVEPQRAQRSQSKENQFRCPLRSLWLNSSAHRYCFTASRETSVARARLGSDAPGAAMDLRAAPGQADQGRRVSAGTVIGLALAFLASAIALGIAFGIRRRIDRMVPPPDDEED